MTVRTFDRGLDKAAREAAKAHIGGVAYPTVAVLLAAAVVYASNLALVIAGVAPAALGALVAAAVTYVAYTPVHESVHRNVGPRALNEAVGLVAAQIMGIPLTAHRAEHLAHHGHTNHPAKDPDFIARGFARGPLGALRSTLRLIGQQLHFYVTVSWPTASRRSRLTFLAEIAVSLSVRGALVLALGVWPALLLLVVGPLAGFMFLAYWFAFRVHHPYETQGRYHDTNTLLVDRRLAWLRGVLLGQDLHAIHHLFPRVPWFRYRAVFAEIRPLMEAQGAPMEDVVSGRPGGRPTGAQPAR